MARSTYGSPAPVSHDEKAVAPSPLGLSVNISQNKYPNIATYSVAAGSGYDTSANPLTVSGAGRLFFVANAQVTAMRVRGTASGDVGITVPAGAMVLLAVNAAGNVTFTDGGTGTPSAPTYSVTAVQTSAYAAAIDELVRVNPTAGAFTVTLRTPVGVAGQSIIVKNVSDAADEVTIATAAGLIDGLATFPLSGARAAAMFTSDGANWMVS